MLIFSRGCLLGDCLGSVAVVGVFTFFFLLIPCPVCMMHMPFVVCFVSLSSVKRPYLPGGCGFMMLRHAGALAHVVPIFLLSWADDEFCVHFVFFWVSLRFP